MFARLVFLMLVPILLSAQGFPGTVQRKAPIGYLRDSMGVAVLVPAGKPLAISSVILSTINGNVTFTGNASVNGTLTADTLVGSLVATSLTPSGTTGQFGWFTRGTAPNSGTIFTATATDTTSAAYVKATTGFLGGTFNGGTITSTGRSTFDSLAMGATGVYGTRMFLDHTNTTTIGTSVVAWIGAHGAVGALAQIGMGYQDGTQTKPPVIFGSISESVTGSTKAGFFVATRTATTDVAPTERFRVTSAGTVNINTVAFVDSSRNVTAGTVTATGLSTFDTLKVQNTLGQPNAIQIRRTDNGQAWGIDLSGYDFNINDMLNNKMAIFSINDAAMTGSLMILDANVVRVDSILNLGKAGAQIKAGASGALTLTGAATFSSTINSGAITATGKSTFDSLHLNGILRVAATQKIRGGDITFLGLSQLDNEMGYILWEHAGAGALSIRNANTGFLLYNITAFDGSAGIELRPRSGLVHVKNYAGNVFTVDTLGALFATSAGIGTTTPRHKSSGVTSFATNLNAFNWYNSDFNKNVSTAAQERDSSSIATWFSGGGSPTLTITGKGGETLFKVDSTSAWTAYTPVVTSESGGWTNYTVTGQYRIVGKMLTVFFRIYFNNPSAAASQLYVGLPTGLTMNSTVMTGGAGWDTDQVGFGVMGDSGVVSGVPAMIYTRTTQKVLVKYYNAAAGSYLTTVALDNTAPWTWTTQDTIDGQFTVPLL